jgi:hypothetical protein
MKPGTYHIKKPETYFKRKRLLEKNNCVATYGSEIYHHRYSKITVNIYEVAIMSGLKFFLLITGIKIINYGYKLKNHI